jgi:hypothetical protein
MMLASRPSLFAILTGVLVCAGGDAMRRGAPVLEASSPNPLSDADGDLLPDALEWVTLTQPGVVDTDADGIDDFLEAVTHEFPRSAPRPAVPLDHEMRALVAIHEDATGAEHVVFHVMIRIAAGGVSRVTRLTPFIEYQGTRVSIDALFAAGLVGVRMHVDPVEGLLIVVSSRIAGASSLSYVLPCAMGVSGTIGQKNFETGAYLMSLDGVPVTIAPISETKFAFQPLNPKAGGNGGFWQQSHVCELELTPLGSGGGSEICEVSDAGCTGAPTLRCAPSCEYQEGKLLVVPNGLGLLTGR